MASLAALRGGGFVMDQGAELLSPDDALDVALLLDVEHDNGEVVVHAQGDGGRVHDLEAFVDHGDEGELRVFGRAGILHGIVVVDAGDLGALEDDLGPDLHRAQRGGRVGGEIRIAGARREDDHTLLFQVSDRAPADVGFGQLAHFDGGLNAGDRALFLERVLQGERVEHGGQHAHVIGRGPLHAAVGGVDPPVDVPPADDQRDLDAHRGDLRDLRRDVLDHPRVDPERLVAGKHFSADLQQDALVRRLATLNFQCRVDQGLWDVFPPDVQGLGRGDLEGQVADQGLKFVVAGHEIGFAIDLDQHPHLAAGVDVGGDRAFMRGASDLLPSRSQAFLAQPVDGLVDVVPGFHQALLAVYDSGAGLLPVFLDAGAVSCHGALTPCWLRAAVLA